ncbi:hypothetical protein I7I48_11182 [Histoplasma ohiense]|nr:hypothetical protein I7I48_11182 [Histoplasma ohiense (nom. inval.)]
MHSLAKEIGDNEYNNSNSNHNKALHTLVTQSETSPVTVVRRFLKIKNHIQRSPAINESPSIPFLFFFSFSVPTASALDLASCQRHIRIPVPQYGQSIGPLSRTKREARSPKRSGPAS